MANIEITTAQQVPIQYELAAVRDRILAWFLDMFIVYGLVVLIASLIWSALNPEGGNWLLYLLLLPIILFYPLLAEIFLHGQTIGKRILQLRVVRLDGEAATAMDYTIRWLFRLIDISLSLGSVAVMLISSSEKGQRLGGIVSHTVVIKLRPTYIVSLTDVLNLREADDYTPTYPQMSQFTDKDMMIVKEALDRTKRYPNKAHQAVLQKTARIVQKRIQVTPIEPTAEQFLRTALRDYVILTR